MANIQGLDQFLRSVESISAEVEDTAKRVVSNTALQIESDAKRLTPVDTGTLRRSINTSIENSGMTGIVSTNIEYAIHVEFGTSRQTAQPYMTPAYAQNKDKYAEDMKAALRGLNF